MIIEEKIWTYVMVHIQYYVPTVPVTGPQIQNLLLFNLVYSLTNFTATLTWANFFLHVYEACARGECIYFCLLKTKKEELLKKIVFLFKKIPNIFLAFVLRSKWKIFANFLQKLFFYKVIFRK